VIDDLPGSGLAHRARYRNHFESGLPAIFSGEVAEGFDRVINSKEAFIRNFFFINVSTDNSTCGAFSESLADIIMAIKVVTSYRKKTISRLCRP
jgi:hypothetical protein